MESRRKDQTYRSPFVSGEARASSTSVMSLTCRRGVQPSAYVAMSTHKLSNALTRRENAPVRTI